MKLSTRRRRQMRHCNVVILWFQCVDISSCGNYCVIGYSSGHADVFNMQSGLHRGSYANPTTGSLYTVFLFPRYFGYSNPTRMLPGVPPFLPILFPCPFTSSSFCSFYFFLFSFSCLLCLFSPFVHSFPFYQNSHHSVSRPEILGGDRTWVQFVPLILCYLYCLVEIYSGVLLYLVQFCSVIVVFPCCRWQCNNLNEPLDPFPFLGGC